MTTLVKKDLSEAVERLGWAAALRHLADMAREEGQTALAGTLRLLSDVLDVGGDVATVLGLPEPYDLPAEIAEYRAQQHASDAAESLTWEPPFGETD